MAREQHLCKRHWHRDGEAPVARVGQGLLCGPCQHQATDSTAPHCTPAPRHGLSPRREEQLAPDGASPNPPRMHAAHVDVHAPRESPALRPTLRPQPVRLESVQTEGAPSGPSSQAIHVWRWRVDAAAWRGRRDPSLPVPRAAVRGVEGGLEFPNGVLHARWAVLLGAAEAVGLGVQR